MRVLTIMVPGLPPSANRQSRVAYLNRTWQKGFAATVYYCAIDARNRWEIEHGQKWETFARASITISFRVPTSHKGKPRDYANMLNMTKTAIDALHARKRAGEQCRKNVRVLVTYEGVGLFADDSPECLTWLTPPKSEQVVRIGTTYYTIIEIKEVKN